PELPGAPDDIFDIFSVFRSLIIPGILKKSLQIFIQDISLLVLENLPLKNAEIDLPDPFVRDHRYLPGSFPQYEGGRLAGPVKGTGKADIKRHVPQGFACFLRQAPALRRKMDIRAALHFFQLVPDGYPVSYYINLHQLLSSIPREVSPLRIFFITAVISASSRVLS